jgi:hypothetical protein
MTEHKHHVLRRNFRVDVPPAQAMHLFTPAGERLWAEGWDPEFPAGEQGDGGTAGTVFITRHGDRETVWTVASREPLRIRYARTTPGHLSGVVDVCCCDEEGDGTRVDVLYDLTALSPEGEHALHEFCVGYDDYIDSWARDIAAVVAAGRVPEPVTRV